MNTAPVALFAHSRPEHTLRTLSALKDNHLAIESDLYVFVDGPRNQREVKLVDDVLSLVEGFQGFRNLYLKRRPVNLGLAENIALGVTEVVQKHGKIIVLEDDIVTASDFLTFMNEALDHYQDMPQIWHINGWNYPMNVSKLPSVFAWRVMHCWGWATWRDRWDNYRRAPQELVTLWDRDRIHKFNLDGAHDFWSQVLANAAGKKKTWAVFWYASIMNGGGRCISPAQSLVDNIGLDGSGENCSRTSSFKGRRTEVLDTLEWPTSIEECKEAVECAKEYYGSLQARGWRRRIAAAYNFLRAHI